mgnify:CR=1 FL=1
MADNRSILIVVDTNRPDQVECKPLLEAISKVCVVDHHRRAADYIDPVVVNLHEPYASSAAELTTEVLQYAVEKADVLPIEAKSLMAGIFLDTKSFNVRTGERTFEAAAFLRKKGADTVNVRNMFSSSIDTYMDKYKVVSKAEVVGNCAVSTIDEIVKNSRLLSAQAADEMLTIRDVYASFVISRIDSKTVNISARSYGKINVQLVMEKLGGGGHQNMAAAQLSDCSIAQAKEKLIEIIKSL